MSLRPKGEGSNNIDFLVQKSTKKILELIRSLPDRTKLEEAFNLPMSSSEASSSVQNASRFTRHPRNYLRNEDFESDGDTTAPTIQDEVVVIKNALPYPSPKTFACFDSSDDYCDMSAQNEEFDKMTQNIEERIKAFRFEPDYPSARVARLNELEKIKNKARPSTVADRSSRNKSMACYRTFIKEIDRRGIRLRNPPKNKPSTSRTDSTSHAPRSSTSQMQSQSYSSRLHSEAISLPSTHHHHQSPSESFQDSKVASQRSDRDSTFASEIPSDDCSKTEIGELRVIADLKFKGMVERSLNALKECRSIFECGIEPADGREDFERRKKRTVAFISRFSRHFLYQLIRIKIEIENIVNPLGNAYKATNSVILGQKFYNAYNTIYQALTAYRKHLPTGALNGMPPKFRELLDLIIKLNEMYNSVCDKPCVGETMIDLLSEVCHNMLNDSLLCSTRMAPTIPQHSRRRTVTTGSNTSEQQIQKRLSMYSSSRDGSSKNVPPQKYQVASKYRTATFKHRPPPQPVSTPEEAPSKLLRRRRIPQVEPLDLNKSPREAGPTSRRRSQPLGVMDIDSDVSTFVEDTAFDQGYNLVDPKYGDTESMQRYAQEFFNRVTKGTQPMSTEEYGCILDHFLEIVGEEKLANDVSKPRKTQQLLEIKFQQPIANMSFEGFVNSLIHHANSQTRLLQRTPTPYSSPKKSFKSRTISVTGPDNAKLFCVKEAQSDEGCSDVMAQIQMMDPNNQLLRKLSSLSITQCTDSNELIYKEKEHLVEGKSPLKQLKLKKVPVRQPHFTEKMNGKDLPLLSILPKEQILKLIEYKLQFHTDAKASFLYQRSPDFCAWLIISRIADTLLEETVQAVARDIQVDKLLEKIYLQEFQ